MDAIFNDRYQDSRDMSLLARDQYEREVSWIETESLSPEEEKKYLDCLLHARRDPSNALLQDLGKDARSRLTEHYQPVIRGVVLKYVRWFRDHAVDFLDLVQEANIALLRAFDTDDFESQQVFLPWMCACVRVSLMRLYWEEKGFVRLDYRIQKGIADVASVECRFQQAFGRSPSLDELSFELGVSSSRLCEFLHYRCLQFVGSVDSICERHEVPEDYYTFVQMYRSFSEEEIACSAVLTQRVEDALSHLPRLQREVTRLRYGLCGESSHTEQEVCDLLGIKDRNAEMAAYRGKKKLRDLLAPLYERQEVAV